MNDQAVERDDQRHAEQQTDHSQVGATVLTADQHRYFACALASCARVPGERGRQTDADKVDERSTVPVELASFIRQSCTPSLSPHQPPL